MHTTTVQYTRAALLAYEHPYEVVVRRLLLAALVVGFFLYASLVATSVLHVIARKQAVNDAAAASARIAALEQDYFALSASISLDRAGEFGLTSVSHKHFVTRAPRLGYLGAVVSDNEN